MISTNSKPRLNFLSGGGEMGQLIGAVDWSRTPLGPVEQWPQSLKISVSLILSSRHPMWIGWGPEMTFLYNDAYLHVLGPAKHSWALGRPASEVWAEIWDVCGPLADKVFEDGEASFVDDVRLFMNRGDFLEETFYSFSYSPIRDESGKVSGLFCPSTDVTPKVLNARRLRTLSELAANALLEKTTAAACATAIRTLGKNRDDIPFALLYLANADNRTASLEQTVGSFGSRLLTPESVDLTEASEAPLWPIREAFGTAHAQTVPVEHIEGLPQGVADRRVVQAIILPLTSRGEDRPFGVLITGVNPCRQLKQDHLTFFELIAGQVATAIANARAYEQERKRAEALAEIDRAKTVFFSNVSHEFRTPLTLMLGPLEELLAKSGALPREQRGQLEIAHRNSLRLLKLVNSLLDFSRIEAGRIKASYVPVDLSALTADLASNFRSAMESAGLQLIVDCPPLPEPVYVDREMWEKIVLNVLSNAFKFTFAGSVTVGLRARESHAELTVSDTGAGIPESELAHIFERFHRVEGARGRTYEGAGIGLALIQELVRLHGGSIAAISQLNEGSAFTISVPFGAAHLPRERIGASGDSRPSTAMHAEAFMEEVLTWLPENDVPAETAGPDVARRGRILLADDNADMRDHIRRILGREYEVITAADGEQALKLARGSAPDLVLSDIMMPRLDGFGLLRALRGDAETKALPVILLSARAGEESRVEGMEAGADDYLVKPFTARELQARVGAHLTMAQNRRLAAEREAALRADAEASRDKAVAVLEAITDGFLAFDAGWRFTYVNAEAERLNGMRREDLLGKNHWEVFPAAVGTTVHRELLRAMERREAVEFENHYAPWDRWFHIKAYPAADGGLSVFFEDITERKRAGDLLVEQRKLLELIASGKPLHECLSALCSTVSKLNPRTRACILLADAERRAFQRPIAPEIPASFGLGLHGAPIDDLCLGTCGEAVYSGTPVTCEDIAHDGRWSREWRDLYVSHGVLAVHSTPIFAGDGAAVGSFMIAFDEARAPGEWELRLAELGARVASIALERDRSGAALRAAENELRLVTDVAPVYLAHCDQDARYVFVNRAYAQRLGLEPEQIIGKRIPEVLGQAAYEVFHGHVEAALRGESVEFEAEIPYEKIGSHFMHVCYEPERDPSGAVRGLVGAMTDISARRRMEEELRCANRDLEQFAYSASHDLQEPLRSISIYSELLSARYRERLDGQALEFLTFLQTGSRRIEMLVRDLLTYTQVNRIEGAQERSDANDAVRVVLANLDGAIRGSRGRVTYSSLPAVWAEGVHLQQIFQNLVGNALKYRSPDRLPVVHVNAELQIGHALFSVRDNGIGIDPEYRERIFGLFKRLHTGDEYSGTGLGLAICKRIVERYDGRIWVESTPGVGSTFYFILPA